MSDTQAIIDQLSEAQMSFDQNQCQAALVAGQAEIERLQAIVDRLPKTADGVPVVPGRDKAWAFRAGECRQGWVVAQGANDPGAVEIVIEMDDGPAFGMPEVSECYSTREAAEKARDQ